MTDERREVERTQDEAKAASETALEAAAVAHEAVEEANAAVKDYWAARDSDLKARYRLAEARRRKRTR